MKHVWLVGILLLGASCATMSVQNLVGTWRDGDSAQNAMFMRLRSDGKGYYKFNDANAGFLRWTVNASNVVIRMYPDQNGGFFVGEIDPETDALILVDQDQHPVWLYRVDTKEPPDLETTLLDEAAQKAASARP